ncbi:MAG: hypothetical protein CVU05_00800 [Bacteroidetes bacterium HGW-Bacteroidetes-21]|jgi:type IX secretion system PorP/SprF family membrane protein|nr:MAG: hypothetical protein CVU05_00800 [Bacteroidetes bacterium HGW-Bacteroidetes-21]
MRKSLILLFVIVCVNQMFAQQDPQFSLNSYNHLAVNPGFAGLNNAICVSAINRNQWMGFEGRPVSTCLAAHMPLKDINSGVGINIVQDKHGFNKDFHFNAAYSYHVAVGDGLLGLGLGIGMLQKAFDGQDLKSPLSLEDPNANVYLDPAIPHSESKVVFDANFGAFYRAKDFYVGLSTTHLTQPQVKLDAGKNPFVRRHYYIAAAYFWQLPDPQFELRPSIFLKYDGATAQYDVNATLIYNKQFWGGVTYRFGDAVVAMVGYNTQMDLGFGLAYDITLSSLRSYQSGSIELMVRYCFSVKKAGGPGSYKSVRFL